MPASSDSAESFSLVAELPVELWEKVCSHIVPTYGHEVGLIQAEPSRVGTMSFYHSVKNYKRVGGGAGLRNWNSRRVDIPSNAAIFCAGSVLVDADNTESESGRPWVLRISDAKDKFFNLDEWATPSAAEADINRSGAARANLFAARLETLLQDTQNIVWVVDESNRVYQAETRLGRQLFEVNHLLGPGQQMAESHDYEAMTTQMVKNWAWRLKQIPDAWYSWPPRKIRTRVDAVRRGLYIEGVVNIWLKLPMVSLPVLNDSVSEIVDQAEISTIMIVTPMPWLQALRVARKNQKQSDSQMGARVRARQAIAGVDDRLVVATNTYVNDDGTTRNSTVDFVRNPAMQPTDRMCGVQGPFGYYAAKGAPVGIDVVKPSSMIHFESLIACLVHRYWFNESVGDGVSVLETLMLILDRNRVNKYLPESVGKSLNTPPSLFKLLRPGCALELLPKLDKQTTSMMKQKKRKLEKLAF